VIRREFDYQIRDYANGKPIEEIPRQFSQGWRDCEQPGSPVIEDLDALPWVPRFISATSILPLQRSVSAKSVLRSTPRAVVRDVYLCLWPQTLSGHRWAAFERHIAAEVQYVIKECPHQGNFLRRRHVQLPQGTHD